jgi:endonuclease-3
MDNKNIHAVIKIIKEVNRSFPTPAVTIISDKTRDPFMVLISCILSLRTQDNTTSEASKRLFRLATTPLEMQNLSFKTIEKTIYPVGFYRNKARIIKEISKVLVQRYDSRVPDSLDALLELKGVGRKTANLVLTIGYGKAGICVDTHVHRITNRWGYVKTKTPEQTEFDLRKRLPEKYWIEINNLLVTYGQNVCKPISPFCSRCRLARYCSRIGVKKNR